MRLSLALFSLLCVRYVKAKAVFAHFMVTNSANYTATTWLEDIKLAQEAHIDAFALNMAYNDPVNPAALSAAFAAAESLGFKLFFSFDYAGNGPWSMETVIGYIYQYSWSSAYYLYHGRPLVSTFEGPANWEDWITVKARTGCFFIPDWSSLGAKPAWNYGVADGLFSWAAWPWGNGDMNTYTDASYNETLNGAPYMMPVSPWFYTNLPGYGKNWLWRGDDLWYDRWQQIIYFQPEFVEIISWNDYGESHYIGPLRDDAMEAFEIGQASYNYAWGMPHDGWRQFLPFVIDLYKSGTATVTREGLTTWYRKAPAASCATGGTSGNTASQLQLEFAPIEVVQDRIYFTALLGSPASITISIGGVNKAAEWKYTPDRGIGLYHGNLPIDGSTGEVILTLSRNGHTVTRIAGELITVTCEEGIQNWNAWVGSSSSPEAISATPPLNTADQKCIRGTGSYNFEGLCSFACSLGYCPVSACTCQQMGAAPDLPKASNIQGYPIAGEDASYLGLCSFDCTYGYCPDTACGTVEVPLTTPTVSDFSPPACIRGSGKGNLAGLCDFTCQYGYCPLNACTCDATGALVLSTPTVGIAGHAIAGVDASLYDGLCNFACSRGYCPTAACATSSSVIHTTTALPIISVIPATGSIPTPSFDPNWRPTTREAYLSK